MAILFALAKALEARDDNTSAHSLNVTKYSMLLGQRLGLDEEQLRILGQGAMLHDLGKIGLPDDVLKKPGELDDPDGLDGEDIPLLARIVAIADTWDAMTSDRIYRQGMSEEVALAILEREKHLGQWDPYLIDEFIKLIRHEHGFDPFDQTS